MGENKDQQVSSKKPFSLVPYIVRTIIIVLAGSAMLPYETFLCVVLYSLYILLMSRYAFPKHEQGPEPKPKGPVFLEGCRHIMASYIKLAAFIGLYFPFAYILLGLALGQKAGVHTAAPHTFLLACQVLSERLSASLPPLAWLSSQSSTTVAVSSPSGLGSKRTSLPPLQLQVVLLSGSSLAGPSPSPIWCSGATTSLASCSLSIYPSASAGILS
ncbi:hypothetical protein L7F22_002162 [Adiantum nelumboides]|nr:hypothetical protein [Adiantum nelumboides]